MQRIILPILSFLAVAAFVRWTVKDLSRPNQETKHLVAETDLGNIDLGECDDDGQIMPF